jgi:four helix bundle protein
MAINRPAAKNFRDLLVWQKAHEFVLELYRFTSGLPRQETYSLMQQVRRAAVSIPANIAEGVHESHSGSWLLNLGSYYL